MPVALAAGPTRTACFGVQRPFRFTLLTAGVLLGLAACGEPERATAPVVRADEVSPLEPPEAGIVPAGGDGWRLVGVGVSHSCALTVAGQAWCWGANGSAQLGMVDVPDVCGPPAVPCARAPQPVATTRRFASLSVGSYHTCALDAQGAAWCWGENGLGQLGAPSPRQAAEPIPVATTDRFVAIAAGDAHTCALRADGVAVCWGQNEAGELGRGSAAGSAFPRAVSTGERYVGLAAGTSRSCAWTVTGTVSCWGRIWLYRRDGLEWTRRQLVPAPVAGANGLAALSVGLLSTCGLDADGRARCWESNTFGQLGTGDFEGATEPVPVAGDRRWRMISAGSIQGCAIGDDRRGWCWGNNSFGQLGDHLVRATCAVSDLACAPTPVPVRGALRFTVLATGLGNHTCGVTTLTNLYCWGLGTSGQLGDGDDGTVIRWEATRVVKDDRRLTTDN